VFAKHDYLAPEPSPVCLRQQSTSPSLRFHPAAEPPFPFNTSMACLRSSHNLTLKPVCRRHASNNQPQCEVPELPPDTSSSCSSTFAVKFTST
jgi:hypothetical protein